MPVTAVEYMKKGETPSAPTLIDVSKDTRRKIAFLIRKPFVEQREVYETAKKFFKSYLKKPVEFTAHELKNELHKVYLNSVVRQGIDTLIEKLGLIEFTDTQYSQAELKALLQDMDQIVQHLVVEHKKRVPWLTRMANWMFRKQPKPHETIISETPAVEPQDKATIELNTLLEDVYAALDKGKVQKAVKFYKTLQLRYDQLGASVQHQFYHKINEVYEAILKQNK